MSAPQPPSPSGPDQPPVPACGPQSPTMFGTIKVVRPNEGYGFIIGEDGVERFFHRTFLEPPLTLFVLCPGRLVEFTPERGPGDRGPRAIQVRLAS